MDNMPASDVKRMQKTAVRSAPVPGSTSAIKASRATAAPELIGGNRRIREHRRDRPEHARGGAVAQLEDVGHRVERESPDARRDEVDQGNAGPGAGGLPERGEAGSVAEPRPAKQAPRPDPGRQQREDQHTRRQRPAGHQKVVARLDAPAPPRSNQHEHRHIEDDRREHAVHHTGVRGHAIGSRAV